MGWLNINGNWIGRNRGGGISWSSYWTQRARTWHKGILSDEIVEVKEGLNAKIMPRVALFNRTNNYLYNSSGAHTLTGPQDIYFDFQINSANGIKTIMSSGGYAATGDGISIWVAATTNVLSVLTSDGTAMKTATFHTLSLNTFYSCRMQWDGVSGHTMTVTANGVALTSTDTMGSAAQSDNIISIGCYRPPNPLGLFGGIIFYVKINNLHEYHISGLGKYEYDCIGTNNLTWYGDARTATYNENAPFYPFTDGYKIYKKDGELNEYLPTGADATAILAAGYALAEYDTYAGSATELNMFPCLIDFDPNDGTNALLDNFDRSNTTIGSDLSRASTHYDAANPYRWHISEIADPRIYTEFLNVGYAGKIFSKITTQLSGGDYFIKSLIEVLNLKDDQTGADQDKAMEYCGSNVFAI